MSLALFQLRRNPETVTEFTDKNPETGWPGEDRNIINYSSPHNIAKKVIEFTISTK